MRAPGGALGRRTVAVCERGRDHEQRDDPRHDAARRGALSGSHLHAERQDRDRLRAGITRRERDRSGYRRQGSRLARRCSLGARPGCRALRPRGGLVRGHRRGRRSPPPSRVPAHPRVPGRVRRTRRRRPRRRRRAPRAQPGRGRRVQPRERGPRPARGRGRRHARGARRGSTDDQLRRHGGPRVARRRSAAPARSARPRPGARAGLSFRFTVTTTLASRPPTPWPPCDWEHARWRSP